MNQGVPLLLESLENILLLFMIFFASRITHLRYFTNLISYSWWARKENFFRCVDVYEEEDKFDCHRDLKQQ